MFLVALSCVDVKRFGTLVGDKSPKLGDKSQQPSCNDWRDQSFYQSNNMDPLDLPSTCLRELHYPYVMKAVHDDVTYLKNHNCVSSVLERIPVVFACGLRYHKVAVL